jgi:uncharacterized protein YigE (DUF2233 family)
MKKTAITLLALTFLLFSAVSCGMTLKNTQSSQTSSTTSSSLEKWGWKQIEKGLSYAIIHSEQKDLLLVKIDPTKYSLSIYENQNRENALTIEEIHEQTGSLLTFNGGFFTEDFKPTGLLISNGRELRAISPADLLNGIIALKTTGEIQFFYRTNAGKYPLTITPENYSFAIQNGPALINQNGEILVEDDSKQLSSRTALGVDRDNNLVLITLKQSLLNPDNSISLYNFAHLLKYAPELESLELHSVLNLDGGSSTGLMIDGKYFPEMEKVQNVITVKVKS